MPDAPLKDLLAEARQVLDDAIVIDTLGGAVVHPTPHVADGTYEAGVPGYEAVQWFGIAVPTGTPREVIQRLNNQIKAILALPDVRARFADLGFDGVANSPNEFGQFLRAENAKWKKIADIAGIKLD
jgi:tripartite-type tricarboxylate transporter receptor subunit TctC